MSRRQLTHKQHAFLEFLKSHVRDEKVWPTYREIVDHFNYRSPNSVTQNLQALAKKGYLRRDYNGYHLVDREGKDGSLPLQGTVRSDCLEAETTARRLSLTTLFPGLAGHHVLRIDDGCERDDSLRDATYLFVGQAPEEGDLVAALHEGCLTVRRLSAGGRLTDPDGEGEPIDASEAEVLGRFGGHAGAYGLVRPDGHTYAVSPGGTVSFS
ncbi:MAG: hypothetical protein R3181_01170 [Rubricoccaceae bacterium]|nr:hypothetical protein [Rubricoccaceae bacterium]